MKKVINSYIEYNMKKRVLFIKHFFKRFLDKVFIENLGIDVSPRTVIQGRKVYDYQTQQRLIAELLAQDRPICIMRPGNAEFVSAWEWDEHIFWGTNRYKSLLMFRNMNSDDSQFRLWVEQFNQDMSEADAVVLLGNRDRGEDYLCEAYWKPKELFSLENLHYIPYSENAPFDSWVYSLRGKRVLIVSLFADTIDKQLPRMREIWGDKDPTDGIEFVLQKSVWFVAGSPSNEFESWWEALEYLDDEIKKKDFDVAIVSAGPFSMHLCANIKRRGGKAIQYGGALQLLFGIKGNRWENHPLSEYYNDYWVRPSAEETPIDAVNLENACYW